MTERLIIIMGPSGCGKTTVAAALADVLRIPMLEGDAFHPVANRDKMASGNPLDDGDRAAWVEAIVEAVDASNEPMLVLACSALTPFVQSRLEGVADRQAIFVLLAASRETLAERITSRTDHFMPASLLDSQMEALNPPEHVIRVDASQSVDNIIAQLLTRLEH